MSDEWQSRFFVLGVVTFSLWVFFEQALPLWGYHVSLGAFVLSALGLQ